MSYLLNRLLGRPYKGGHQRPSVALVGDRWAGLRGHVFVYRGGLLAPATGEIVGGELVTETDNTVVNQGYARTAAFLAANLPNGGAAIVPPTYLGIGTGAGQFSPTTATHLLTECSRSPLTSGSQPSTYVARLVGVFGQNQPPATVFPSEVGLFDTAGGGGGTSTGGNTSTTLNDTTKSWTVNQWAGYTVNLIAGTGAVLERLISSNTATQLTVGSAWIGTPDATTAYYITPSSGLAVVTGTNMFAYAALVPPYAQKTASQVYNVIWQITVPSF